MKTKRSRHLYQIKITLKDSKPPIWRRLLIHSDIGLSVLHDAIQCSMGWSNYHLHQFEKDSVLYGVPDDDFGDDFDLEDENQYRLSDLLQFEKDSLIYEYDFGDGWRHKVTLEKILPFDSPSKVAKCIKGKMACPPEDCGGIWGYENLLLSIKDPTHEEHEEMLDWLGGDFDPEYFSLTETNERLSRYVK